MLIFAAVVCCWVICGIGAAGIMYADFDSSFPTLRTKDNKRHRELLGNAIFIGFMGPIGFVVAFSGQRVCCPRLAP